MASRWIHKPTLHTPMAGKERRVGWLELFYDLVYVATLIQLGNALSYHYADKGIVAVLAFAGLLVPLWLTWTAFTFLNNRYVLDDAPHRALVFLQMFAIAGMAVSVPDVMKLDHRAFVLFYAGSQVVLAAIYLRLYLQEKKSRALTGNSLILVTLGAVLWVVSAFVAAPWTYGLWAVAIGLGLASGLSRHSRELATRFPPDVLHLTERYGLLTIIVLGESFVKVLSELAGHMTVDTAVMGVFGLLVTCSLWWIYFDDVAGSRIKRGNLAPFVWIYAHLPLTIAITGVGVAVKKVVAVEDAMDPIKLKYRLLFCGFIALTLLMVGVIDAVTERRQAKLSDRARVQARVVFTLLVLGMAFVGGFLPGWSFLAGVTFLLVVQVLFDISMAPVVVDHHHEAHHEGHALFGDDHEEEDAPVEGPKRWTLDEVIRRGAPNELRRDLYFNFVEGSWTQALVAMAVLFILVNAVFAALYLVEPWGVSGLESGNFLDAFAFSVQTIATIGYGTMSPETPWAHTISIIEAAVGLAGVALATGLMFAKASRPRSSVLFSKVMTVNQVNGVPTLVFRAGNARGSEVVEARIMVTALIDEVSPEGERMRKLYDLQLVRSRTPIFAMSWTVLHPLTPDSPLYGISPDNIDDRLFSIVVTLAGHDATYASTTHARIIYYPEDVRFDHRFVDVIHTLEDGRLLVDYTAFHRTIHDPVSEGDELDEVDADLEHLPRS